MYSVKHGPLKAWEKKQQVKTGFKTREEAREWIRTALKGRAIQKFAKIKKETKEMSILESIDKLLELSDMKRQKWMKAFSGAVSSIDKAKSKRIKWDTVTQLYTTSQDPKSAAREYVASKIS